MTDQYAYSQVSGGYRIGTIESTTPCSSRPTGYLSSSTNDSPITPSQYNGLDIVEIGRCAFGYTSVKKVVISKPVTTIQCYSFTACRQLIEVSLPSTVSVISYQAFEICPSLAIFNFCRVDSVELGSNIFYNSNKTMVINVPTTSSLNSIDGIATTKVLNSITCDNVNIRKDVCLTIFRKEIFRAFSLIINIVMIS
jgi:hypothetical protein